MAQADTTTAMVANTDPETSTTTTNSQAITANSSATFTSSAATSASLANQEPTNRVSRPVSQDDSATPVVDLTNRLESYEQGHWYLKNNVSGQYLNGWQSISGNRVVYYSPTNNQMEYGEQKIGNNWYYLNTNNGDVVTGWKRLADGRTVYYDVKKGTNSVTGQGMFHGIQAVNGSYYYFNIWNGDQQTGFKQQNIPIILHQLW